LSQIQKYRQFPVVRGGHFEIQDMPDANGKPDAFVVTCVVLVGAAFVQLLKHATAKTFDEYAHEIFMPYTCAKLYDLSRMDLV